MRKRLILGTAAAIFLMVIIAFATVIPSLAESNQSNSTPTSTIHGTGGNVILQLPPGGDALADRPTALQITVSKVTSGEGEFFGPGDIMQVLLWVPQANSFVPVALVNNNPNPDLVSWMQSGPLNGTPIAQNILIVEPQELEIEINGDVVMANLTASQNITLSGPMSGLSFSLPPVTLEIHGLGGSFSSTTSSALPSGWNLTQTFDAQPAWVRVWIPQWLGSGYLAAPGTMVMNSTTAYTSP